MNATTVFSKVVQAPASTNYATLTSSLCNLVASVSLLIIYILMKTTNVLSFLTKKKPEPVDMAATVQQAVGPAMENIVNLHVELIETVRKMTPQNSLTSASSDGSSSSGSS